MAVTNYSNFGGLTGDQLQAWSRSFWKVARNNSFINQFAGSGSNAMVQRVTELTKSSKGTKANITLLADMVSDGITGDNTLEGQEEALRAFDISIQLDQLRFANRIAGRLEDQKTVVNFREQSRDTLAYAMADRIDQLAFLTLSGCAYTLKNNGGLRTVSGTAGHELVDLEFASDVSDPTSARSLCINGGTAAGNGVMSTTGANTASFSAFDTMGYRHIVELKAYAKDNYIRGIRGAGNQEIFHMFVTPQQMAKLKLDSDFLTNVRNAGVRGEQNSLFSGSSSLMVDGVMIHAVIGHSLGGSISALYTALHPEKVNKLVAIEGMGPPPKMIEERINQPISKRLHNWMNDLRKSSGRLPRRYQTLEEAFQRMQTENPHLSEDQARHLTIHGSNQNEDGTFSWKFDNYVRNFAPIGVPFDEMATLFGDITCPTLLVRGLESWASDPIADGRTKSFNCKLEVEAFADAGHWVHHDQLDGFVKRVKTFLAD